MSAQDYLPDRSFGWQLSLQPSPSESTAVYPTAHRTATLHSLSVAGALAAIVTEQVQVTAT